jgi:hypothetical protein
MKLKKNQSIYLQMAVKDLVEDKIDLHFSRTKKVDDCGGFFCPESKELKVAIWNKFWFSIFIHEFNHYKQWKNNTRLWDASGDFNFFEDFNPRHVLQTQLMEQECDKMVWKDIKKWGIEDEDDHISLANAYHASYVNMSHRKSWVKIAPYKIKDIVSRCPNDRFFTIKELRNPDKKLYNLIDKMCF